MKSPAAAASVRVVGSLNVDLTFRVAASLRERCACS
jgi:hypothetical protein